MRYFLPYFKIFVLLFIFMCFLSGRTYSQSKILANEITVSSNFSHSGNNASNALNDDPGSFARSVSSPGLLIGAGAVTGVLELQFPETRPAGSVSYIQIDGDENLFNALLGGSLGDALSGVLGAIILGNQVITVEARNNTTTVLSRNSNQGFSIDAVRLVQDKDGNFYLALRPGSDYNRIRITNEATSLVGLFAGYTLDVYNAFHLADEDTCGSPWFTSFDGSGLNLDLLDIGNVGVNDLENAIDGDFDTYSTISPGLLSLGGSLSQFFDFGSPSIENDEIQITLSGTEGVLDLTLLGSIQFRAYNGTDLIYDENLAALNTEILGLLQIDLLGLLADGNVVTIPIQPGGVFDRFEIIVNGVLSVGTNESLRIHEVFQTPGRPTYENPEDANLVVCATDDVTISVVSQADETVHWYAQPIGGEILETGNTFNIGNVSQRSVYYAGTSRDGCPVESSRVPVTIEVDNNPQIAILGSQVFTLPVGESLQLPEAVAFNEDETEVDTEITPLDGAPFQGGGIAGPFNSPGVYVYRVSATGDNCTNFLDITVNVQDFEDCPLVLSPGFANDGTEFTTSSLLGIQLGTVTNPNNAVDGDLSTFSLLEETVGTTLLGLTGETAQFLKWNIQQPAGNTVTVKLGREYAGTAQLAAGIYIQPFDNGQPVGNRTFADVNLVSVLNGLNEFNFTFVPTDFSGQPVSFDAVKVSLVPILNFDQVVRVYGAYTNIASVDAPVCEPVVRELQTGFVSLIGALDVATSLTGVFNPERAVDGDLTTFASITNAVGVNVYSKLEVAYNYPILVGDSLKVTLGIPTGLLDLSLLEGLIIQRFLGNEAIGEPIDASSSLLSLRLLTGNSTGELSFVSEVPFDRIRILYGGLASVLEEVRIFEIEAIPNVSIEGEFFDEEDGIWKLEICEGETIELEEGDCGEIRLFAEAEGGDEIDLASISALERGETLNVFIQVDRFGCELDSHRRLLEITITGSAPPAGEAEQSFCESDNPTIADLIIAGENIKWYDLEEGGEALEAGTPLVSGETYYASQTEEGECESIERFAVLVEVLTTPAPTAPALIQEFCSSDNATLAQIAIEGENIQWYASESDQTPLSINTLLVDGVTFFASQTDPENGCESLERIGITITLVDCEPDLATLAITKTAGSSTVVAGTELNYTITVSNTGTAIATGVTVSDELPEFTEFVSTDNGGELTGNTVNWDLGDLGAGESVTINLVLFVPADVEAGTMIRNVAVADSPDDPDGPVDNDPDPEDDVEVVTEADLSVMKSADVSLVQAGSNLRYVISVTNNGPSDAQDVSVSDVLPAGTTFVSADNGGTEDGGTVSWSLGTMTPGQSIDLELIVAVGEDLEDGTVIRNTAVVDSPTDPDGPKESDPEDVTVENDARAKLEIEKTAGSATVVAGTELNYTITVSNTGTAIAGSVSVSDELPEFTEFVSTDNGGELTGNTVNWDLGDLGAGESVTINLVLFVPADVEAGTMIRNVAVADSPDDPDGPVDNDPDPEDDVEVVTEADLSVMKSADVSLVQAGSNLRYVISVTNNGPSDAQEVSVSDVLPAGTTFVSADNGGTEDGGTVSWSLGTMTPGQSIELELIVAVGEDLEDGTVIRNIAVVDSPTDPDGPKESDPEDVTVENDARAKLEIEKTAGSATVVAGTELNYTITVSNTGTATAGSVSVSDELPEFTEFVSTDNGGELTGNMVNWDLGDLGAGESVTINLVLFVPADVEAGTMIRNVAVADSPDDPDGPVDNDPDPEDDVEVVTEADLSVMKSADVSLVQAGSNLRYVISVTNHGPSDAQDVSVSDVLPAGTTFVSADNGGTEDGGTVSWSLGTMTPGQSIELELIVAVGEDLEDGTVIRNIAVVNSPTDPDGPKESDPEDVTVEHDARAKLEIEKTAGSATVVAGTELNYTITVSNTGTAIATGVTVSDELPEFTEFVSTDNGGELTGNTVNWDLGDLGAGESVTINLVLFVPADVEAGTMIRNVAVADSPDDPDGPVDNDPDPEDDVEVVTEADLSVMKSADVSLVQAGSNLRYVISVTNNGPSDAQDVSVSDVLPAGTTFVSADNGGTEDGGTVSWSLGTMTPGQSIELELIVAVGEDLEDGTVIRNIAVVNSPTDPDGPKESDPEDVTVEHDARAKLEIEKTAGSATVVAGTELNYTITVSNTGTAIATGVTVSDELPEFTEFVSTDNGGELTGNTVNWDLGDLGAGESVTINLVLFVPADVEAGTMIRNVAVADSPDDPDGPVDNDPDPEDDVEVVTEADLSVMKSADVSLVQAGSNLRYVISVTNHGPSDAQDVSVSDVLPAGTTFVSADNGGTEDGGTVSWSLGTMTPGQSIELELIVAVGEDLEDGTVIRNIAVVDSPTDPDGPKESDPEDVTVENDARAKLEIEKTAGSATVVAGTELNYTITVSNTGTATAGSVSVSDELPEFTEFVSTDNGGELTGNTVNWDLGDLGAGESVTINLVLFVPADVEAGTMIRNVAVADSPDDPDGPVDNDPDPEDDVEVVTEADLSVMKSADVSLVQTGSNLRYVISVTNNGPSDAQDVSVSDVLPAGTTFVSADNGGTEDGGTVSWSLGTMTPGQSIELELIVAVGEDLEDGTVIRNIAVVDSPTDPDGPKESDPEDVMVDNDLRALLTIEKIAGSSSIAAGAELSYQITISNRGTASATDVTVTDPIPEGTSFVSANLEGSLSNGIVIWNLGTIEPGASVVLELTVMVDETLAAGTVISNIATVESPDDPEGPKENDPTIVEVEEGDQELTSVQVEKSADVEFASPGDMVEFTIRVTNTGNHPAINVEIVDQVPAGLMPINANSGGEIEGQTAIWRFDSIMPGETETVILTAMVTAEEGSIVNNVRVSGDNFEDEDDDSDPISLNEVDLAVIKEVSSNIVGVGTQFQYRITISNNSDTEATEVEVSDFLPTGVRYLDSRVERGSVSYDATLRVLIWEVASLEPGASLTMEMDVLAETPGEKSNTARVNSRELDLNETDNTSTVSHTQIEFEIPNVFTPNGDGINDTWEIKGIQEFFSSNSLLVVNRWGVEVYRSENYSNQWDGGNLLEGTYYYQLTVIRLDGTQEVFKGYVTILR